ncbi:hypothetical protein [Deinococcus sp. RM]|uniref:hypothetical protein n=1 Tax=Deinococcus sp. RM TaxID=2316359 RepID=UPI000E699D49|nr:hypothetical protein [Deinococcus sp. RM]RIY06787.1 hypothetical protein D3W47_08995 [Deinococcus sp. RM]
MPRPQTTELAHPTTEHADIDAYVHAGLKRLRVDLDASPRHIVGVLREHLDAGRETVNALDHDGEPYADFILEVGHVWGAQVVRAYGWHWGVLHFDGQDGGTHVIHPEGRAYVHPIRLVMDIVNSPGRSNNTALLFSTLAPNVLRRHLPDGLPGAYIGLH